MNDIRANIVQLSEPNRVDEFMKICLGRPAVKTKPSTGRLDYIDSEGACDGGPIACRQAPTWAEKACLDPHTLHLYVGACLQAIPNQASLAFKQAHKRKGLQHGLRIGSKEANI